MSLQNKRQKDSNMAAAMKRDGIKRKHTACPMCHRTVSLAALYGHLGRCN
jgi:ribosomal protein S27AE